MTDITPLLLARISEMAYDSPAKANFERYGFNESYFVNSKETDTQAYVLRSKENIVVVFRGTSSLKDWETDLNCDMQEILLVESKWITVHEGFFGAWHSVKREILREVPAKGKNVYITGHSLGGALAVLAALQLTNMGVEVSCHTFASPRVGNDVLRDYFKAKDIPTYCYHRDGDPAYDVPPKAMGYRHLSGQIELKGLPWWVKLILGKKHSVLCHLIKGYIKILKKRA